MIRDCVEITNMCREKVMEYCREKEQEKIQDKEQIKENNSIKEESFDEHLEKFRKIAEENNHVSQIDKSRGRDDPER